MLKWYSFSHWHDDHRQKQPEVLTNLSPICISVWQFLRHCNNKVVFRWFLWLYSFNQTSLYSFTYSGLGSGSRICRGTWYSRPSHSYQQNKFSVFAAPNQNAHSKHKLAECKDPTVFPFFLLMIFPGSTIAQHKVSGEWWIVYPSRMGGTLLSSVSIDSWYKMQRILQRFWHP